MLMQGEICQSSQRNLRSLRKAWKKWVGFAAFSLPRTAKTKQKSPRTAPEGGAQAPVLDKMTKSQFSFRSPSLIQPSLRSASQNTTLRTAGRTKHSSTMAAQSMGVMAALVPAAMSLTQPVYTPI